MGKKTSLTRKYLTFTLALVMFMGIGWDSPSRISAAAGGLFSGSGDWSPAAPEKEGMDGDALNHLVKQIQRGTYGPVHDILIVHNGKLVLEKYFRGYHQNRAHSIQSGTKSITSLLVGIALQQQKIHSLDDGLLDLMPRRYRKIANLDDIKRSITLQNILSMTAGFDWDESSYPYTDNRNSCWQMKRSHDWIRFVLDKPMAWEPGTRFTYNTGCSMLLSAVIKNKTGLNAADYARKYLFNPLGFKNYRWGKNRQGYTDTGGGLYLRPRDIAKIGLLMLNNGKWGSRQIVPAAWVSQSTQPYRLKTGERIRYGYQWWLAGPVFGLDEIDQGYLMKGYQGQYTLILPDKNLVIVSNAWGSDDDQERALFTSVLGAMNSAAKKPVIVKRQSFPEDTEDAFLPYKDLGGLEEEYPWLRQPAASDAEVAFVAPERSANLTPDRGKKSLTFQKTTLKWRISSQR